MRRLARPLFALCSAVSLLLCVAVCVLWAHSNHASDSVTYVGEHVVVGLTTLNGQFSFSFWRYSSGESYRDTRGWQVASQAGAGGTLTSNPSGFGVGRESVKGAD
jgi:hypothetical protein